MRQSQLLATRRGKRKENSERVERKPGSVCRLAVFFFFFFFFFLSLFPNTKRPEREWNGGSLVFTRFFPLIYILSWRSGRRKRARRRGNRVDASWYWRTREASRENGRAISAVCMRGRRQTLLNCPMTPYIPSLSLLPSWNLHLSPSQAFSRLAFSFSLPPRRHSRVYTCTSNTVFSFLAPSFFCSRDRCTSVPTRNTLVTAKTTPAWVLWHSAWHNSNPCHFCVLE